MNALIDTAALDALFAPYDRTDAPGFAVGVALGGKPGYRRGFGMASIELPIALSPSIRMRIGSTTKHFCVLAVMLLAEEGRLSIDESPRRYISELPEWAEEMTLRQLMAHTSGMRDSLDLIMQSGGMNPNQAGDQLRLLMGLDSVNFAPGQGWSYNNGGYVLLTEIVERLSGEAFGDFLKRRILDPVGMYDTVLRPLDTELLPNSATLHMPLPNGGYERGAFGGPVMGEGGIASTVDDMLLWLKHMSAPTVGAAETWATMRTPHTSHGFGLGLRMETHRGLATVHHAGAVVGGSSQMIKVIDHELDIIIMTNGRSWSELYNLVDAIIDTCIPGLPPVPEYVEGEVVSGNFHSAATGRVMSLVEHEGRQATALAGQSLPVHRAADGTLSMPLLLSDLKVTPCHDDGRVDALDLVEFGVADRLERIALAGEPDLEAILGHYSSPAARLTATITVDDMGKAHLLLDGPWGATDYSLEALSDDVWQLQSPPGLPRGGMVEFDDAGLRYTSGRTVRLRFDRVR